MWRMLKSGSAAALLAWHSLSPVASAQNTTLLPFALKPLPLGSTSPQGWLKDQLQLMSDGLAGHERDFYLQVSDSVWLGGNTSYSDLNEAFGYWFNGLVPLAYGLGDERLQQQVMDAANYILSNQYDDGWIGPEPAGDTRYLWGRMPVCLGLIQLAEALNGTDDQTQTKILDGLHRYINLQHSMLADGYMGYDDGNPDTGNPRMWGRARQQDMMISLQWIAEHDPRNDTQIIFESLQYLLDKAYNWSEWYTTDNYIFGDLQYFSNQTYVAESYPFVHGVNVGQGLKASAVIRRFTQDDSLVESSMNAVNWTFTYHGNPSGSVIGDEVESGLSPIRGTELCTVVETMYSLSYLYHALGDGYYADRCELAAFNALPIMLTPDWWAHQYVGQTNQPVVDFLNPSHFYNTDGESQIYSIEPNYPCCAVNHPQGYPKFVSGQWAGVGANGIGHALLGPSSVNTTTESGTQVNITCDTNYPFSYTLTYSVQSSDDFDFYVRVPGWANQDSTTITVNNGKATAVQPENPSNLQKVSLKAGSNSITYTISTELRVEARQNNTVAIYHGNLLYALPVGGNMVKTRVTPANAPNPPPEAVQYTYTPITTWQVAIDPTTLHWNHTSDGPLANPIWDIDRSPVEIYATVCQINWPMDGNWAFDPPADRTCTGDKYQATLYPYATSRLHMAQLPTVDLS